MPVSTQLSVICFCSLLFFFNLKFILPLNFHHITQKTSLLPYWATFHYKIIMYIIHYNIHTTLVTILYPLFYCILTSILYQSFIYFLLLSSHINCWKKKEFLHRKCTLSIQYLDIDQILLSNSSNSSQKGSIKFFFLPLFLKSSNSILKLFTLLLFLIGLGNLLKKIYYSISKKIQLVKRLGFCNLPWQ